MLIDFILRAYVNVGIYILYHDRVYIFQIIWSSIRFYCLVKKKLMAVSDIDDTILCSQMLITLFINKIIIFIEQRALSKHNI